MFPSARFLVTRPEETIGAGSVASSPIPTFGHPALAQDHYRIAAFVDSNMDQFNVCFTDVATCVGLARIIEGPVESFADIEAAETALNAILFHQNIEILIPTVKLEINGLRTYARPDQGKRSDAIFEVFNNLTNARDWLCAYDYVLVEDGRIVRTERDDERLTGVRLDDTQQLDTITSPVAADVFPALAFDFKVPGYFSEPSLVGHYAAPQTFTHELYDRIKVPWREHVSSVPGVDFSVHLPPLLAIVLTRAGSRQDIPRVVQDLHEQLGPIRYELYEFDQMVRNEREQAELERKTTHIQESFAAIIPESRENKMRRSLARMWHLVKPLSKAYGIAINPTQVDPEALQGLLEASHNAVMEDASLVDRTMSARVFSELLRTESVTRLLRRHFSNSELRALETTYRHD